MYTIHVHACIKHTVTNTNTHTRARARSWQVPIPADDQNREVVLPGGSSRLPEQGVCVSVNEGSCRTHVARHTVDVAGGTSGLPDSHAPT